MSVVLHVIHEKETKKTKIQKPFVQGYNFDMLIQFHCNFPLNASILMFRSSLKRYDSQLEFGTEIVTIA